MAKKAAGKTGLVISKRPKEYGLLPQQKKLKEVLAECDIKKGIKKEELQKQMVECVGPKMREWGEQNKKKD